MQNLESELEKPRAATAGDARASPSASVMVVDVVGARPTSLVAWGSSSVTSALRPARWRARGDGASGMRNRRVWR